MRWLSELRYRLRALTSRPAVERELEEELRDHLERDIANRVQQGADPDSARRETLRLFGGVERWKEESRSERGTQLVEESFADARHAMRRMQRSPGFSAVVVCTLAIGVGASTTIFSVVNGVLLRPLPYHEPERLVALWQNNQVKGIERDQSVGNVIVKRIFQRRQAIDHGQPSRWHDLATRIGPSIGQVKIQ